MEDEVTKERFRKEARVWVDLERHPYLVRASFVDEINRRLYIAMEHITPDEQGLNTLEGHLQRRPPDLAQILRWSIQFCYGMEYAYSRGVRAHRDIKPANIMIGQDKMVKITDFGLAGVLSASRAFSEFKVSGGQGRIGLSGQTMEGTGFGTPTHMPPEQFTDAASCDETSDIYAFGVVLYQMASGGKLPFLAPLPRDDSEEEARRFWKAMQRLHCESPLPRLDSPLFPAVWCCLHKERNTRFQSFMELRSTEFEPLLRSHTGEVFRPLESKALEAWEWCNKGNSLNCLGLREEAVRYYDRALEIDPRYAPAWLGKGASLGREKEAIRCFDHALEIDSRYALAWYNKGIGLDRLGCHEEAARCLDRALEIEPLTDSEATTLAALSDLLDWLVRLNKDEAEKVVSDMREKEVRARSFSGFQPLLIAYSCSALSGLFGSYRANVLTSVLFAGCSKPRDHAAGRRFLRPREHRRQQAFAYHIEKGVIHVGLSDEKKTLSCDEIVRDFTAAQEAGIPPVIKAVADAHAEMHVAFFDTRYPVLAELQAKGMKPAGVGLECMMALMQFLTQCAAASTKAIDQLLSECAGGGVSPFDARVWCAKGTRLAGLSHHKEATQCYDSALETDPRCVLAWFGKGNSLRGLGRDGEAVPCYDHALEIDPSNALAWRSKGDSLGRLGRSEEAIQCYDHALEIDPRDVLAWQEKGYNLGRLDRYEEAIRCYDRALEIDPRLATAWHGKGSILICLNNYDQAIPCFDHALEIDPRFALAWRNKGYSLCRLNRPEEAIPCLDCALETDPRDALAWYHKGNSLFILCRHKEAIPCYGHALEIDPGYARAWFERALAEEVLGQKQDAVRSYRQFLALGSTQDAGFVVAARQRLQALEGK